MKGPTGSPGSMSGARVQGGEKLSAAEEDQFRDYSTNLNPSKPMGLEDACDGAESAC